MKPNDHPGGFLVFRGAINWGFACFLGLVFGLGIYAVAFLTSKGSPSPKLSQLEADFKSFDSALAMYKLNGGNFPSTAQGFKALVKRPADDPVPVRWVQILPKIPLDPWGQPYLYQFPGSKDAEQYEIISRGPDGAEGTPDDLSTQDE